MSGHAVPKIVKPRFEEIIGLIGAVCGAHLNDEYATAARELAAALARKRPSPLMRGQSRTWACGITYTIGTVNFLFDPLDDRRGLALELAKLVLVGLRVFACPEAARPVQVLLEPDGFGGALSSMAVRAVHDVQRTVRVGEVAQIEDGHAVVAPRRFLRTPAGRNLHREIYGGARRPHATFGP